MVFVWSKISWLETQSCQQIVRMEWGKHMWNFSSCLMWHWYRVQDIHLYKREGITTALWLSALWRYAPGLLEREAELCSTFIYSSRWDVFQQNIMILKPTLWILSLCISHSQITYIYLLHPVTNCHLKAWSECSNVTAIMMKFSYYVWCLSFKPWRLVSIQQSVDIPGFDNEFFVICFSSWYSTAKEIIYQSQLASQML